MKHILIIVLIGLTVLAAEAAAQTVLYSENFDSYSGGSPLTVAGWSDAADIKLSSGTAGLMTGRWLDGASAKGTTNQQFPYYLTGLLDIGVITLSANLYWRGIYSEFGCKYPEMGVWNVFESRGDGNIYFYSEAEYTAGILMTGFTINDDYGGFAEIVLDFDNHRMKGTLTDPIGNHSATTGWLPFAGGSNVRYAPNQIYVRNYVAGTEYGIRVDNIQLVRAAPVMGSILVQVELQDYSGDYSVAPVEVKLIRNGGVIRTQMAESDRSCTFTLVEPGDYEVAAEACKWLPGTTTVTVAAGIQAQCVLSLTNGDADGDGTISDGDIDIVIRNLDATGH